MSALGRRITAALGSKPQHGTVIRWESKAGYLYMAVAIEQGGDLVWYTSSTGNPYVPQVVSSARLLDLLFKDAETLGVTNDFEEVSLR